MLFWVFVSLFFTVLQCLRGQTAYHLVHINNMDNLAQFDDAQHRGPNWYDYSVNSFEAASTLEDQKSSTLEVSKYSSASTDPATDSSAETSEKRRATQRYRACHPCPHDMLKKYTNIGIKWICAGYQRARRSFKSECMLRYRNCQDGTMFVKVHDHKCRNESYHGRHWFYGYLV
uniref:SFRICE_009208 n=1 Tax=Spodoptera frugiperda TaxID=7108 RepID=A0A2H1WU37_SPOFR